MFYPNINEFKKLARKGNLVPVYKEIVADLETPVSAFKKIEGEYSFLLESIEGGEKIARYSFLGTCAKKQLLTFSSLEEVRAALKKYRPVETKGLPRFTGGLVGYISYDAVREIERLPDKNLDDLKMPQLQFLLADAFLAFDHVKHKILIIANAHITGGSDEAYRLACARIAGLERKLKRKLSGTKDELEVPAHSELKAPASSNLTRGEYEAMVRRAKEYIRAGDIIQVVLSQRLEIKCPADSLNVYRILRMINPSPYMYYLKLGKTRIIGSSPEVMVRLEKGEATLRPIAGTKPRGRDEAEDQKLARELLASAKERAEHIMLVDLGRNDLGRVCAYGSVKVTEEMSIEKYSHVMHIVSNVTGQLQPGKDAIDLVRACFPAGTVSGAPKVRAMEIIDELENRRRGLYAGSVGYFSFSGDLDSGIAIRTILIRDGRAFVQAGAGLVADSVPAEEYQETLNKARALLAAVELAG
ncbi:MAG: anthranilate synthase component I [Candidatus Margulisiibacteriota bacterium]